MSFIKMFADIDNNNLNKIAQDDQFTRIFFSLIDNYISPEILLNAIIQCTSPKSASIINNKTPAIFSSALATPSMNPLNIFTSTSYKPKENPFNFNTPKRVSIIKENNESCKSSYETNSDILYEDNNTLLSTMKTIYNTAFDDPSLPVRSDELYENHFQNPIINRSSRFQPTASDPTIDQQDYTFRTSFRNLNIKDALDLVPMFNGTNIPVATFIRGLRTAKNLIPPDFEANFTKMIVFRITGEALSCIQGQRFNTVKIIKY